MLDFTAQCFETGKYDGNIKKNGGINIDVDTISNVEDPESCQKECLKNLECKFWTYNNEFAKWKKGRKKCWLQNANAPETAKTCTTCTRGPRVCPIVEGKVPTLLFWKKISIKKPLMGFLFFCSY